MRQFILNVSFKVYALDELDEAGKTLVMVALKACSGAYAPFSGFSVGAAVLLANGEIIAGNNQENAAFPSGLCAERVAVFFANARYPDVPIVAVAVTSSVAGKPSENCAYPCGACRQVLLQSELRFGNKMRVLMAGSREIYEADSAADLLPLSFTDFAS
ncbi:MAG: cytidine deaminase [Prevotellaceae bacterium]|jgi:cytidine deaminase|nr:cytidine deaminase [Prevotellaceae bacterium]